MRGSSRALCLFAVLGAGCGSRSAGETDSTRPELVSISVGDAHSCVLAKDGTIDCWGANYRFELGDGTNEPRATRIRSAFIVGATALSAGDGETCAIGGAGAVFCWGSGDRLPRVPEHAVPRAIGGLRGAVSVGTGDGDCALVGGEVSCWSSTDPSPRKVEGLASVKSLGVAGSRGCALLQSGEVRCFDPVTRVVDREAHARGIETLVVGLMRACGITSSGTVSCWFTDTGFSAVPIAGSAGARALSVNTWDACALSSIGEVRCWSMGETTTSPALVEGLQNVTAISGTNSASDVHCAIVGSRTVSCWKVRPKMVAEAVPGF